MAFWPLVGGRVCGECKCQLSDARHAARRRRRVLARCGENAPHSEDGECNSSGYHIRREATTAQFEDVCSCKLFDRNASKDARVHDRLLRKADRVQFDAS